MSLTKPRSNTTVRGKQPAPSTGNPALDLFHRQWQALEKQQAKLDKQAFEYRASISVLPNSSSPSNANSANLFFSSPST